MADADPAPSPESPPGRAAPDLDADTPVDLPPTLPSGLSEEEAADRRARGLGNVAPPATTRTYTAIVRENVFTFVNNVLFLMGLALVLVGRPFDAFVSLAVISTNILVGIVQEVRAKQTLDRIALLTRPTAKVVRDGDVREVRPEELVVGDLIAVEAGDQIVVDGRLAEGRIEVDESQLTGESDLVPKRPGDRVFSGSYPTSGRGRYVAETVGEASLAGRITTGARTFRRTLTPLQREIQTVIRVTLAIVLYLQLLLVVKNVLLDVPLDEAVIEATVLVGLIPNGLFVSIAIAYALAAVRMTRYGALVQQANAVESLSHVDMLCVDKTGTLTANQLELEQIVPLEGEEASARAAVALMVASSAALNKTSEAIAAAVPVAGRAPIEEAPFSSARKWSAVSLPPGDEPDAAPGGTYAMGAPTFLQRYLAVSDAEWRNIEGLVAHHAAQGMRVLLAAWSPDATTLVDEGDASVLPADSRPYALIVLRDVLRQDAAETLRRFRDMGVDVRVISGDDPDTVATLARQAGLDTSRGVVSGPELEAMDDDRFSSVAERTAVFGRITPAAQGAARGHLPRAGALRGHDRGRRQRRALAEALQPGHRHGQRQPGDARRGGPHPHRRWLLGPGLGHRRGPAHPQRDAGHPARLPDPHPVAGHAHRLRPGHRLLPGRPAQRLGHHALHGRHPHRPAGHLGTARSPAPGDAPADAGALRRAPGGRGLLPGPPGGRGRAAHGRGGPRRRPRRSGERGAPGSHGRDGLPRQRRPAAAALRGAADRSSRGHRARLAGQAAEPGWR